MIQQKETLEAAKCAIEFYKTCGIPFKYHTNYHNFNERYRDFGYCQVSDENPLGRWPNAGTISRCAEQLGDKGFLAWEKKMKTWNNGGEPFMPVIITEDISSTGCKIPGFKLKSPESIEHNCDVDIIRNLVFTVKMGNGSKYGDFDHVLTNDDDIWHLRRVGLARCPHGSFHKPKDFKKILYLMPTLGKRVCPDGCKGGDLNPEFVKHLTDIAKESN